MTLYAEHDTELDLVRRFGGLCAYCGRCLVARIIMEHVEPTSRGGRNAPDNIVPSCGTCNSSKSDLFLLEWVFVRAGLVARNNRSRRLAAREPGRDWQRYPLFLAIPSQLVSRPRGRLMKRIRMMRDGTRRRVLIRGAQS